MLIKSAVLDIKHVTFCYVHPICSILDIWCFVNFCLQIQDRTIFAIIVPTSVQRSPNLKILLLLFLESIK